MNAWQGVDDGEEEDGDDDLDMEQGLWFCKTIMKTFIPRFIPADRKKIRRTLAKHEFFLIHDSTTNR